MNQSAFPEWETLRKHILLTFYIYLTFPVFFQFSTFVPPPLSSPDLTVSRVSLRRTHPGQERFFRSGQKCRVCDFEISLMSIRRNCGQQRSLNLPTRDWKIGGKKKYKGTCQEEIMERNSSKPPGPRPPLEMFHVKTSAQPSPCGHKVSNKTNEASFRSQTLSFERS